MNLIKRLSKELKANIEIDNILNDLNEFLENDFNKKISFLNYNIEKEHRFFSFFITDVIYDDIINYFDLILKDSPVPTCSYCKHHGRNPDVSFRRIKRTNYTGDEEHILLCDDCYKEYSKYWDDMWSAYYSMVL